MELYAGLIFSIVSVIWMVSVLIGGFMVFIKPGDKPTEDCTSKELTAMFSVGIVAFFTFTVMLILCDIYPDLQPVDLIAYFVK